MPRWLRTPRWLGLTAALALVVTGCALLGWWQWQRATTQSVSEPPPGLSPIGQVHAPGDPVAVGDAGRRVLLRGSYDADRELLVVDRLADGAVGSWVLTAFVLGGGDHVAIPVVRGWIPQGDTPPAPPAGRLELEGWLEPSEPTTLRQPGREPLPDGQVEIVSSAELLSLWQPPLLQGFVIAQDPAAEPPMRPVSPPSKAEATQIDWQNLAYAIQWWLFGLFAVFWFARMVREEQREREAAPLHPGRESVGTIRDSNQRGGT